MTPILVSKYFLWIFCIHKKYLETGFVKSYFKKFYIDPSKQFSFVKLTLSQLSLYPFLGFKNVH